MPTPHSGLCSSSSHSKEGRFFCHFCRRTRHLIKLCHLPPFCGQRHRIPFPRLGPKNQRRSERPLRTTRNRIKQASGRGAECPLVQMSCMGSGAAYEEGGREEGAGGGPIARGRQERRAGRPPRGPQSLLRPLCATCLPAHHADAHTHSTQHNSETFSLSRRRLVKQLIESSECGPPGGETISKSL